MVKPVHRAVGVTALSLWFMFAFARNAMPLPTQVRTDNMKFELHPPDALTVALTVSNSWSIYATGTIDEGAPTRLATLIQKNHIPAYSTIYLNSPGGSLMAGIKLGQMIRASGFNTEIGAYETSTHTNAAVCLSACTLTFLGGKWRYMSTGSVYGVHRFYFQNSTALASDIAQMLSAVVVQYIRDMGVDPQLFSDMTTAGKDELTLIPNSDLLRLNVINDGETPTEWSIQSVAGTVYLRGQRDTVYGLNKFLVGCIERRPSLMVLFDPQGHESAVSDMKVISLRVDNAEFPLDGEMTDKPGFQNGLVHAMFSLPPRYVQALLNGREVGVEFQLGRGAAFMLGFDGMKLEGARDKLIGVLRGCAN